MLSALSIENLALVDRIQVTFAPGLNVLTGETGAGKSVLVSALSLLLGGRASVDVIRTGREEAIVEAMFDLEGAPHIADRLGAKGIGVESGELVVRRVVSRSGKGRITLNGQMATVSMLSELVRGIVDITGQHEHVSLLDPEGHLEMIDAYGCLRNLRERLQASHGEVVGVRAALDALAMDESEKARREDYLRFALDEIAAVDPKPGELEVLEAEHKRLKNASALEEGVRRAEGSLYSDDGAIVEIVGRVEHELLRLTDMDDRLRPISGAASGLLAELEDLARQLSRYQGSLHHDPDRLSAIEERLEALRRLVRKHAPARRDAARDAVSRDPIEAILRARGEMARELDDLENDEARKSDLVLLLEAEEKQRDALARELSSARHKVVRALEKAVKDQLAQLCMEKTALRVELRRLEEVGPRGAETAELMISPNAGEPLRALRRIASGGELSRILLAVKHVLLDRVAVSTYVFDEIDSGIGGAVAEVLGRKLKEVARHHQVLCVTHLPQVAAHADVHFRVEKSESDGRTTTKVSALSEPDRAEELARMLGGLEITDRTRSLAVEMRERGRRPTKAGVLAPGAEAGEP